MDISNKQSAMVYDLALSEKKKNTYVANLSTFEGYDEVNGEKKARYASWHTNFVGKAFEKAAKLNGKEKILLLNAKVDNNYNKETGKLYVTLTVFDFVVAN